MTLNCRNCQYSGCLTYKPASPCPESSCEGMGRPSLPAPTVFPAYVFFQNWPLAHEEERPVSTPLGPEWTLWMAQFRRWWTWCRTSEVRPEKTIQLLPGSVFPGPITWSPEESRFTTVERPCGETCGHSESSLRIPLLSFPSTGVSLRGSPATIQVQVSERHPAEPSEAQDQTDK